MPLAPELGMSPPSMALSPERPDVHLLHSHREVWEDKLQWEEIRSMKLQSGVVETSQEPSSTPMLFESTPPSVPSESQDTSVPGTPPESSDDSVVFLLDITPYRDLECPAAIWELAAGRELPGELETFFRNLGIKCRTGEVLTVPQLQLMFQLIIDEKLTYEGHEVMPPPLP